MVSDREVATALRDLIDADPEHGMVLLTADRRVLYSNVAARGYLGRRQGVILLLIYIAIVVSWTLPG